MTKPFRRPQQLNPSCAVIMNFKQREKCFGQHSRQNFTKLAFVYVLDSINFSVFLFTWN